MRFDPASVPGLLQTLIERSSSGDLESRLRELAVRMLEIGRVAVPVMMMSWSNPTGEYRLEKLLERVEGYRQALGMVCGFFERELSQQKAARDVDPEVLARIFMGSLHHYCMSHLLGVSADTEAGAAHFVDGLVAVLLRAIEASTPAVAPARRPKRKKLRTT